MSCEECRDQVFELLEREAQDPEGVGEILSRCPDCRAEFESLKAALSQVEAMPLALPSSGVDDAVRVAARARVGAAPSDGGARRRRESRRPASRRPQPLPWAIAATAFLAVGIGVATSSRWLPPGAAPRNAPNSEMTSDSTRGLSHSLNDAEKEAPAPVAPPLEGRSGGADLAETDLPKTPSAARLEAGRVTEQKAAARRQARPAPRFDRIDAVPMATVAREEALDQAVAKSVAKPDKDARAIESCRKRIAAFEQRLRQDPERKTPAGEQLRAGVCYRDLGRLDQARRWLDRATRDPETRRRAEEALRTLD